jgi:hypothetical protein
VNGIDKIVANGDLAKPYQKWFSAMPPKFSESMEGIPYTAS